MVQWRNHRHFHLARNADGDGSFFGHLPDFHLDSLAHLSKRIAQSGGDDGSGDGTSSGSSSSSSSSSSNNKSNTINTQTLPLVLGILIPALCALIMFIVFHLRHKKKQAMEDAADKHHSLDFGLGEVHRPPTANKKRRGKNGVPAMTVTDLTFEKNIRRGISADLGSPYLLGAAEMSESRTSFNSLSRETSEPNDPYGPVKQMRDRSRSPHPTGSILKKSVKRFSSGRKPLLGSRNSSSTAPPYSSTANTRSNSPSGSPTAENNPDKSFGKDDLPPPPPPPPEEEKEVAKRPTSNFSFPRNVDRSSVAAKGADPARNSPPPPMPPTRSSSKPARMGSIDGKLNEPTPAEGLALYSTYADGLGISAGSPQPPAQQGLAPIQEPIPQRGASLAPPSASPNLVDPRRLSTQIRPLPNVNPDDNAEQRANRIRSFYKEYFNGDDNGDEGADEVDGQWGYGDYGSYDQEYLDEAPIWDPATGQFVMAGSAGGAGWGRRAMTPPPRGPPRFRGQAGGHHYTSSSGHSYNGRTRAYSSASGRAPPRGRPVKRLPPPKALHTLPSVSNLRENENNSSLLDFAPPPSMRDIVAGRPSSPRSEQRPYSPAVRSHTPIVGTKVDMSVMPSPYALRKSGTFTGLEFAAPPRFKLNDSASDAGSIRSGRSGRTAMSPVVAYNVRAGAYRLSRLPKETVGTKDDLAATLRPKWDLGR